MSLSFRSAAACAAFPFVLACTTPGQPPSTTGEVPRAPADGGGTPEDVGAAEERGADACEGTCTMTQAVATFGGTQVSFDRAYFGLDGNAGLLLRVEAYVGGAPECPTATTKDPSQTLIVSGIPRGAAGKALHETDGVAVSLLDFEGNLLATPKPATATQLTLTVRAQDPSESPQWVAFDLEAVFSVADTLKGSFYAPRCASLDGGDGDARRAER